MPPTQSLPTARALDSETLARLTAACAQVKSTAEKTMLDLRTMESRSGRLGHAGVDLEDALVQLGGAIAWAEIHLLDAHARTAHPLKPPQCMCGRPPATGCLPGPIQTPAGLRPAVLWGGEPWHAVKIPCPDCGVDLGLSHHLGCPQAACGGCGARLMSCQCGTAQPQ